MFYSIKEFSNKWIGIIVGEKGLVYSVLPRKNKADVENAITEFKNKKQITIALRSKLCDDFINQLIEYYLKKREIFTISLDMEGYSSFEKDVWECVMKIPYGERRTYGWIANEIGKKRAARAVGNALGKNPFPPIVPCHRVVHSDGSLGGFSGGLDLKRALLELEKNYSAAKSHENHTLIIDNC